MSITHFSGPLAVTSVQRLTVPGSEIDAISAITELATTSFGPVSIAAGVNGQIKTILMTEDNGDVTLVGTIITGVASSIIFNSVGDTATLHYFNDSWYVLASFGTIIL